MPPQTYMYLTVITHGGGIATTHSTTMGGGVIHHTIMAIHTIVHTTTMDGIDLICHMCHIDLDEQILLHDPRPPLLRLGHHQAEESYLHPHHLHQGRIEVKVSARQQAIHTNELRQHLAPRRRHPHHNHGALAVQLALRQVAQIVQDNL